MQSPQPNNRPATQVIVAALAGGFWCRSGKTDGCTEPVGIEKRGNFLSPAEKGSRLITVLPYEPRSGPVRYGMEGPSH